MRTVIGVVMAGLLSVSVLGCATPGRGYDDSRIAMIKKDVTTEQQLLDWFGPATSRAMAPDGSKMVSWKFPREGPTSPPGKLEVKLAPDGRVTAYSASAGSK